MWGHNHWHPADQARALSAGHRYRAIALFAKLSCHYARGMGPLPSRRNPSTLSKVNEGAGTAARARSGDLGPKPPGAISGTVARGPGRAWWARFCKSLDHMFA